MRKTAGIIIIGNEILSGKVADTNSAYLARELCSLGVSLKRIEVIPDEREVIAARVAEFSKAYDLVFTSGGVGPTHDDVTMDGVAQALGVRTHSHPRLEAMMRTCCGGNGAALKMALVPEGAEVLGPTDMPFPPVAVRNIYILPGIPEYLRQKFDALRERFRAEPLALRRVFVAEEEYCIAHLLDKVVAEFPDVEVGSYPRIDADYKVMVTMEARESGTLTRAVELLVGILPEGALVRVE
jgi:molybdenum cofactor synthesis domain-containing protein